MFARFPFFRRRNYGKTSTVRKTAVVKPWVEIEDPIQVGPGCAISAKSIGRYCFVNANSSIFGGVRIGRFTSIAQNCQIGGAEHPIHQLSTSSFRRRRHWFPDDPLAQRAEAVPESRAPGSSRGNETAIGSDVWIGASCVILKGVTIGDGAVVGAGAVVTKDVEPYAIVAGNPASLIRYRFDQETIARLLAARWWDRDPGLIATLPLDDVEASLRILEAKS